MSALHDRTKAKKIVLHHLGDGKPAAETAEELIKRSNTGNYQFPSYDFGILDDGTIVTLRPLTYVGAHCVSTKEKYNYGSNWWNENSIGVVIAIDSTKFEPSKAMVEGIIRCLIDLVKKQGITVDDVYPHFQVTATLCPGAKYTKLSLNTGYLDYDYIETSVAKGEVNIIPPIPNPQPSPATSDPNVNFLVWVRTSKAKQAKEQINALGYACEQFPIELK